jgi:hypothetical protein
MHKCCKQFVLFRTLQEHLPEDASQVLGQIRQLLDFMGARQLKHAVIKPLSFLCNLLRLDDEYVGWRWILDKKQSS